MFKQLNRLTTEVDGRFASSEELQFLKDYLQSTQQRISAYQKIRDAHGQIADHLEEQANAVNPKLLKKGSRDLTSMYRRDSGFVLRHATAAMLFNDLERLQDNVLLWHRTIIRAFKVEKPTQFAYQSMPDTIKPLLSAEEADLMMPALQLSQAILT